MNKCTKVLISLVIASTFSVSAFAADINANEKQVVTAAVKKISTSVDHELPISSITQSPIPGVLQVTSDLNIFYVSSDGNYAFFGDLIAVNKDKKQWSVTEQSMRKLRMQALANLNPKDMIIYPATAKKKLGTVTVFTDLDCAYCHKLHENIAEYTDLGIEIRYLSFPRAGLKSKSYDEAVKVWCAKDKAAAFTKAVKSKEYPEATCTDNPVAMEFELGQQMGVSGTPTMFLENGVKIGGLVDAKTLAKIIKEDGGKATS